MSREKPQYRPVERIGRTWFKYRGLSPVPWLGMILLLPPQFEPSALSSFVVVATILLAEALRLWAVGYAGGRTRTRGETVAQLVHAGPFRHVRNPLYFANIMLYVGCAVLFGFRDLAVLMFAYFLIQYSFIVAFEERVLSHSFGEAYSQYFEKVSRWLPRLIPTIASTSQEFDLRGALRSERRTLLAMVVLAGFYVGLRVL